MATDIETDRQWKSIDHVNRQEEIMAETTRSQTADEAKPRLVGINHVALEVGDIDKALDFYGKIFDFKLRAKRPGNAFIELGDQFINLMQANGAGRDQRRHFGLVVDDRARVRALVEAAGGELLPGPFLDFLDPWGNRVEIVEYRDIQFTKAPQIMKAMGFDEAKSDKAIRELAEKGMAP
ncbi:MAG TPA: VOC family protein [Stellaceae bacterium]|nr:VOC family protein [Stellaceae bacterium]